MKKIIIVANDSEASGKTLLTKICGAFLQKKNEGPFTLVHTGIEDPGGDNSLHIDFSYGIDTEEIVSIVDDHAVTVIDVASGYGEDFANTLRDGELLDMLHELDAHVTVVFPITNSESSYSSLVSIAEAVNDESDYVIVHNQVDGANTSWETSYARKAMTFLDANELVLSDLGEGADEADPSDLLAEWESVVDLTQLAIAFQGEHEESSYQWTPSSRAAA